MKLFYLLLIVYFVYDFMTSENTTGIENLDRSGAHVSRLFIIVFLFAYFLKSIVRRGYSNLISGIGFSFYFKLLLWSILGWIIIVNLLQEGEVWPAGVHLSYCLLWVLTFYFAADKIFKNSRNWGKISWGILVMFVLNVLSEIYSAINLGSKTDSLAVINLAYGVMVFLPWISMVRRPGFRRVGYLITLVIAVLSMKRGVILVFPLMISSALLIESHLRGNFAKSAFKLIFASAVFTLGLYFADRISDNFLSERFSRDQLITGSGRDEIYLDILNDVESRNFEDLFLGQGSGSSETIVGKSAHSDSLEFLFCYGIFGIILYAVFILIIGFRVVALIRARSLLAPAYTMSFVYILTVGAFGQVYFSHFTIYVFIFMGAAEGILKRTSGGGYRFKGRSIRFKSIAKEHKSEFHEA